METKKRLFSRRKRDKLNSSSVTKSRTESGDDSMTETPSSRSRQPDKQSTSSSYTRSRLIQPHPTKQADNVALSSESHPQPPRTPERVTPEKMDIQDVNESSPAFLYSQAPNQEVYWDDNTPQMRKHRAKMQSLLNQTSEEEGSPIRNIILKPPDLEEEVKKPVKNPLAGHDLVATQIALDGIKEFTNRLLSMKEKREQESKTVINKNNRNIKNHLRSRISDSFDRSPKSTTSNRRSSPRTSTSSDLGDNFTDAFSDDDSLLLQCTQEVEQNIMAGGTSNDRVSAKSAIKDNKNTIVNDDLEGFESDESFEMFLTQIDIPDNSNKENSIKSGSFSSISKKPPPATAKNQLHTSIKEQKYPKSNNIFSNKINNQPKPVFKQDTELLQTIQDPIESPSSSRPIKKFRSSDDGIGSSLSRNSTSSADNPGGGTTLRRIRSDNHVTANSKVVDLKPLYTQEQIERKKLEAKMKRQLRSQMKN